MMLAIYFVVGWSVVGCVAALLMGRAIAICTGERDQGEVAVAGAATAVPVSVNKALPAKAA
jgi:hypothetical protein